DLACGPNGATPAESTYAVTAGWEIAVEWHQGNCDNSPVLHYLARVPSTATATNVNDLDWFKIDEYGYSLSVPYINSWNFTIRPDLPNGEYLLRSELLTMH
ncbi:hypothetical protein L873DRAFT_1687634, partial [Choiromyces venosus 120613-1]